MKQIIFVFFYITFSCGIFAQGVTTNGQNTTSSSMFVDKNGKIVNISALNLNGQVITLPILGNTAISTITNNSAFITSNISNNGGAAITSRGVCWSTTINPTISDNITYDGIGIGSFTSNPTNLLSGTTYYLRSYAINSAGISYGTQETFTTVESTVTDIDGNIYHTVTIGTQVWMVENLRTTKYRNGNLIGTTSPATKDINSESTPKYQWPYGGLVANVATYGRLYTGYAVSDSRNIAPTGWHVATDAEWTALSDYLGGKAVTGGKLKETGTSHWVSPNGGATNETGFSAVPGGYRAASGTFSDLGRYGFWWSPTYYRYLSYDNGGIQRVNGNIYLNVGFSVRCVKDY